MFPCISIVFDPVISTLALWRNSVSLNAPYLIFSVPLRSDVQGALQNMLTRWYSLARNPHLSGHRLWERSSLFTWSFLQSIEKERIQETFFQVKRNSGAKRIWRGGGLAGRGFCLENLGVVGERRRAFFWVVIPQLLWQSQSMDTNL